MRYMLRCSYKIAYLDQVFRLCSYNSDKGVQWDIKIQVAYAFIYILEFLITNAISPILNLSCLAWALLPHRLIFVLTRLLVFFL